MLPRLIVVSLCAIITRQALADLPPSPPPSGKKYVSVSNTVQLAAEMKDYVFVLAHGVGPGPPRYTYQKMNLAVKKPASIPQGGKYHYINMLAVPVAEAEQFKDDKELFAAIAGQKIKGLHQIGFGDQATVDKSFRGESVSRSYTITEIDSKTGIKTTVAGEENEPKTKAVPKSQEQSSLGGIRTILAGCALSGAAVSAIWIIRKRPIRE